MEFPQSSKFAFTVKSTTARPPKTSEPELTAIAGIPGKYKINEAASKLLGLKPQDYLVFVNNEDQIEALKEAYADGDAEAVAYVDEAGGVDALELQWGICKGWPMLDANDNPLTAKKPLTNAEKKRLVEAGQVDEEGKPIAPEIPAIKGSRLSTKMKEVKVGMILEGTDSTNAPKLRESYDDDKHVVYAVNQEAVQGQFPNGTGAVDVDIYLIKFDRTEDKIERNS
jgi:hypothetical protein